MEQIDTVLPKLVEFAKSLLIDVNEFYKQTDPAHRIDHIEWVMHNVFTIYTTVELGLLDDSRKEAIYRQALIAAAYHDIFSHHRKMHHFMSFQYVMDNIELFVSQYGLNKMQIYNVAYACMEHRGSWKGPYHSLVSEIVAAADRGIPGEFNVTEALKRSYMFARTTAGKMEAEAMEHSVAHIKEKYGRDGYGRVPDWYRHNWQMDLVLRHETVANLSLSDITPELKAMWEVEIRNG